LLSAIAIFVTRMVEDLAPAPVRDKAAGPIA
jgi:hypothetical protein